MKTIFALVAFVLVSAFTFGQPGSFILSGGWATATPDGSNTSVNGFKIGGQWEKSMGYKPFAMGAAVSYLGFQQSAAVASLTTNYHSVPVTFYGKYLIGKSKLQGYLKAAGGFQFSSIKVETSGGYVKDHDFGLAVGAGAGAYYNVSENVFLNVDYEFLYLTNSWYNNGITNAVTLGVGFKLH